MWTGCRMVWLYDGEKSLRIRLLVLTEVTNVTDGQMDKRTPHDGIGCACTATRGKDERWPGLIWPTLYFGVS